MSFRELGNEHFVTFVMDERRHLVDICALIKVSCDLSQVALEIHFVHATCRKAIVNSALKLKS